MASPIAPPARAGGRDEAGIPDEAAGADGAAARRGLPVRIGSGAAVRTAAARFRSSQWHSYSLHDSAPIGRLDPAAPLIPISPGLSFGQPIELSAPDGAVVQESFNVTNGMHAYSNLKADGSYVLMVKASTAGMYQFVRPAEPAMHQQRVIDVRQAL